MTHFYSFKIFRRFSLAQSSGLILHNQPTLTKFRRYEQYTIDSIVYLF